MKLFKKKNTNNNQSQQQYQTDVDPRKQEQAINKGRKHKKVISTPHLGFFTTLRIILTPHSISKEKLQANRSPLELRLAKRLKAYEATLRFPANMLSEKDKEHYCVMGFRPQTVRQQASMRLIVSILIDILPILAMLFLPKYKLYISVALLILPILLWHLFGFTVKSAYTRYATSQQMRFDYLMSVMSPYLYSMNSKSNAMSTGGTGLSINAVLGEVSDRLSDPHLQNLVSAWNIDIRHNPKSFLPYRAFAAKFLGSEIANDFVYAVYQLSNGATDTSSIHFLNRNARTDYMRQVRRITHKKLKRFRRIFTAELFDWILIVFVYLIVLMALTIKAAMSQVHQ